MSSRSGYLTGIEKLREQADFRNCQPNGPVPPWMTNLAKFAREDLGSLALLGPSGVSIRSKDGYRVRAMPDASALYIVGISDRARETGRRIAVGIPPIARHLPLLLASAAVLAATLEHSRGSNRNGSVLVISRDLDIRSRYCDVYVRKQWLDEAYPGSRMRPDGSVVHLRSEVDSSNVRGGVCFFLPEIVLPNRIDLLPSLIIIDLRYGRWSKRARSLGTWVKEVCPQSGVLSLYSVGDIESASALAQVGFLDVPFDHTAVSTSSANGSEVRTAEKGGIEFALTESSYYLARTHEIKEISGVETLNELFSTTAKLLYEQAKTENLDVNRARWLLAVLSTIPVPMHWFEITARGLGRSTLKRLTDLLGTRSKHEKGVGALIQSIRMQLQKFYQAMETHNPRAAAMKDLLEKVGSKNDEKSILVLVRDKPAQQALESWLAIHACPGAAWLSRTNVKSYDSYSEVARRQFDVVIVNGAVPRRYRWALGAALGRHVIFLAYAHESVVIERQLLSIYSDVGRRFRAELRERSIATLLGVPPTRSSDFLCVESAIPSLDLQHKAHHRQPEVKVIGGLSGLAKALEAARENADEIEIATVGCDHDQGEEDPPDNEALELQEPLLGEGFDCLSVGVVSSHLGRGEIWLDVNELVECVRPSEGEEVLRLQPRSIKDGDILLRMESTDVRGSLFDQMVRLAEGQPEMEYLGSFRRAWREAIKAIAAANRLLGSINYTRIFVSLQEAGAPIASEQTVRLWMNDQVIGPEAIASIEAVGKLSGSTILINQATRFDRAFRQIRAIHQGIGRRLSAAIRKSFRHLKFAETKGPIVKLDDHLGVPLDELLETVDLAEVRSVGSQAEKKPPQVVGRFIHRG
jgi:hypothetical protein